MYSSPMGTDTLHLILVYRNIQQHLVFNLKRKSSHLLLQKTAEGEKNYKMYATRIALQFKKIKWSSENSFTSLLYYFRPESAECYELRVIISFYARKKQNQFCYNKISCYRLDLDQMFSLLWQSQEPGLIWVKKLRPYETQNDLKCFFALNTF